MLLIFSVIWGWFSIYLFLGWFFISVVIKCFMMSLVNSATYWTSWASCLSHSSIWFSKCYLHLFLNSSFTFLSFSSNRWAFFLSFSFRHFSTCKRSFSSFDWFIWFIWFKFAWFSWLATARFFLSTHASFIPDWVPLEFYDLFLILIGMFDPLRLFTPFSFLFVPFWQPLIGGTAVEGSWVWCRLLMYRVT